jgi:ubiquitin C-terminal hydrolase
MKTSTPSQPRRGIANVGNTCYLNSAFQALRHAHPFADYFAGPWQAHHHPDRKGHELAEETAAMVAALKEADAGPVIPSKFVRAFLKLAHEINDDISFGTQADAAEAVQILLDGLHTQLAREVRMEITGGARTKEQEELVKSLESWAQFFRKEYSPLVDAFYGQTQTRVRCVACNAASARYEPWNVLKLPIPGAEKAGAPAPTLQECLAACFAAETVEDYSCEACKAKGAKIEHAASRLPTHLILSLKRFTNTGAKVRARIPYDENNIDLSEWLAWPAMQSAAQARYRVFATVEHLGSSRGGHYIMRARGADDEWLIYDDGSVRPSANGGAAGPDTYMLFLERRTA